MRRRVCGLHRKPHISIEHDKRISELREPGLYCHVDLPVRYKCAQRERGDMLQRRGPNGVDEGLG